MLAPCVVLASVRRKAFNSIPSGEGSFARLMVLALLLLAAVGGFAQTIPIIKESFENIEGSEKIVLSFVTKVEDPEDGNLKEVDAKVTGSTDLITISEGENSYTYKGSNPLEAVPGSSLELLLSDFKNDEDVPLFFESDKSYVLKIPEGTFKYTDEDEIQEYEIQEYEFNVNHYEASLDIDISYFIMDETYGNPLSWDFEFINSSSEPVTIEVSWEEGAEYDTEHFSLTPKYTTINVEKKSEVVFNVSLNNANASNTYKANLIIKPSNDRIPTFNVPFEITVGRRQLTASYSSIPKDYDGNADIELKVMPTNVAPGDEEKVPLVGSGVANSYERVWNNGVEGHRWRENPNVAGTKCVRDIEAGWPADFYDLEIMNNYDTPLKPENSALQTEGYCFIEAIIKPAEWDGEVPEIDPIPSSFTYGDVSLDAITLNGSSDIVFNGSWRFVSSSSVYNPHDLSDNPDDEDSRAYYYKIEFPPPDSSGNYRPKEGEVWLTIHKRSLNNNLRLVEVDAPCGESGGNFVIEAEDPNATVVYGRIQSPHTLNFPVRLEYGGNNFEYSILSQAYEKDNPDYRNDLIYSFERFLPFRKVAYWIRGKTLSLDFDATDPLDEIFFNRYDFDYAKTEWYKGNELVYTGKNYSVQSPGDYSVILTGKDKETGSEARFASCKESGAPPDVTPIKSPSGGGIRAASAFGSRMVPGGISLVLNTPKGGKVSVYTVAGELVSAMNAVDARTVVRLPNAHKMYIVKLEAQ